MSDVSQIYSDDQPLTLKNACSILFFNAITPATLMAEAARGNLQLEKIGRRYFVTPAAIKEMRIICRVDHPQRGLGSGFSLSAPTAMAASNDHGGSSVTDPSSAAQDALQLTLQGLKKLSRNTSLTSTSHAEMLATHPKL
ncbi:MAG: hypothetical protein ACOH2L_16405 [Devosia sp.]